MCDLNIAELSVSLFCITTCQPELEWIWWNSENSTLLQTGKIFRINEAIWTRLFLHNVIKYLTTWKEDLERLDYGISAVLILHFLDSCIFLVSTRFFPLVKYLINSTALVKDCTLRSLKSNLKEIYLDGPWSCGTCGLYRSRQIKRLTITRTEFVFGRFCMDLHLIIVCAGVLLLDSPTYVLCPIQLQIMIGRHGGVLQNLQEDSRYMKWAKFYLA